MGDGSRIESLILVGPPNAGKTTLFNWLTNSRFRAVNYPGSTVDCLKGLSHVRYGKPLNIIDTPGIYGLSGESPDEQVTIRLLEHDHQLGKMDAAIVCVDATQLERHLPLVVQVQALGWPVIVALTMQDLARSSGIEVDVTALARELGTPVVRLDGHLGLGVDQLMDLAHSLKKERPPQRQVELAAVVNQVQVLVKKICRTQDQASSPLVKSIRLDRWLLHPVWGVAFFLLVTIALFTAVFWLADPLMGWVDWFFSQTAAGIHKVGGTALWADFLADGVVASFGAVMVFVPQILILFLLMGVLEDSGYLARAATLVDRPLSSVGLSGRAFVPLLSGYACAVPAILAARTIRSSRERWLAIAIIPLLSCSARLPVYALLLTFLFVGKPAWQAGLTLALIYLGSMVISALAAAILNLLTRQSADSGFLLELPVYRRPQWRVVIKNAALRTQAYARRAGPVIFVLALILWGATNFPKPTTEMSSSEAVQQSYAGQLGQWIEPIFRPMGVDWRVGFGLLSAFAAREVFVSSLALVFNVTTEGEDETIRGALFERMQEARTSDGMPIFTLPSVIGLILFFMIALQCSSTVAVAGRESGSWRFAMMQLVILNLVGYVVSVGVVQCLGG